MNTPFTIEELQGLGFHVTLDRKGAFKYCDGTDQLTYEEDELLGTFRLPPSFADIIRQVARNAKEQEKARIVGQLSKNFVDGLDI